VKVPAHLLHVVHQKLEESFERWRKANPGGTNNPLAASVSAPSFF
jgi:hypothetical protein